jgi:predicted DNA-binding transcriptional regulator AlpA
VTSVQPSALTPRDRDVFQKPREILTERELSDWLGISQPTLSRHRRFGTGPAFVRLSPPRVAYPRTAVVAWLNEREQPTLGPAGVQ